MLTVLKNIWSFLDSKERKQSIILLLCLIVYAFIELAGIVSVFPFLAVLANPDVIHENDILSALYNVMGVSEHGFLFFLGLLSLGVLITSSAVKTLTDFFKFSYANKQRHVFAQKLVRQYISQPYSFFLQHNSSELSKTILSEADQLIDYAILPLLNIITYSLVVLAIAVMLMFANPFLASSIFCLIGGFYVVFYFFIRKRMTDDGHQQMMANKMRFKAISELFGGIKELKVLGQEDSFVSAFSRPSRIFCEKRTKRDVLSQTPKYIVEALAFSILLIITLYLIKSQEDMANAIPLMGLYAFSGYRLMPGMQQLYSNMFRLRFGRAVVNNMVSDLKNTSAHDGNAQSGKRASKDKLTFSNSIKLENISFSYKGRKQKTLSDINLEIKTGQYVGIAGQTGSGKSTLVNIILGLLPPDEGAIIIDDEKLTGDNVRQWQNNIGYVPQHIFLADDSVTSNVALGEPAEDIDVSRVERACEIAQIHDFILSLPEGYNTRVGENGASLSGGQRQRLGIARALYREADILVLDEATSALDNDTEKKVFQTIFETGGYKTILVITHQPETIKNCDIIVRLEQGKQIFPEDVQSE